MCLLTNIIKYIILKFEENMEENINNLVNTLWDNSISSEDEDLIIKKLQKICFREQLKIDQKGII